MNNPIKIFGLTAVYCAGIGCAVAQQSVPAQAPTPTAQAEAGEPRADTSNATATATPGSTPAPAGPGAPMPAAVPTTATGTRAAKTAAATRAPETARGVRNDRLALGTATVTGSQEQPKVMYIVPWKRSDIGDLAGKPMNSLVDEILAPVDRDVFKREVIYYKAVQADASQNGAPARPAQQGEK